MKVAFVGKGGSGKTTISALLCRFLTSRGARVLAIDSDINQHLGRSLGFSETEVKSLPALGVETEKLQRYLRGENQRIRSLADFIRTTPPTSQSTFVRPFEANDMFDYFATDRDGLRFLVVGQPPEDQVGKKCYHSNMGAVSMLLNHLIDDQHEYIVVDLTAGIDTVISGMFIGYDLVFVVVEPTIKSLEVFLGYRDYVTKLDVPTTIIPVANKVAHQDDLDYIGRILGIKPDLMMGVSPFVRTMDRGEWQEFDRIESETLAMLELMVRKIDNHTKDWRGFYNGLLQFHLRKAEGDTTGRLQNQIDDQFDIVEKVREVMAR